MSVFHSNIRFLRKQKGFTQEAMAQALGITRAAYKDYEYENMPGVDLLIKMADYFNISVDTLLRESLDGAEGSSVPLIKESMKTLVITVDEAQNEYIQYVPVKAKAGYLAGYANPEFIGQLPSFRLPYLPIGTYRAFEISGDSMPPISEGSMVIGKYVETARHIKNLHTYVLVTKDEGIVYKRLIFKQKENKIICISDNAYYPPYSIHLENVLEIWSYTCHIDFKGSETSQKFLLKEWVENLDKELA